MTRRAFWTVTALAVLAAGALIAASQFDARMPAVVVADPPAVPAEPDAANQTASVEIAAPPDPLEIPPQASWGDPEAPVTIVEFAEFYCPYCARYVWQTYPLIEQAYIDTGLVRYEFRNLTVHGLPALLAAVAGECAHRQGAFHAYHDLLFERVFVGRNLSTYTELGADDLKRAAAQVGVEADAFDACLGGYETTFAACYADFQACGTDDACSTAFQTCLETDPMAFEVFEDRRSLGAFVEQLPPEERSLADRIGTPTFFINGHILIGAQPYDAFKRLIDAQLQQVD